MAHAYVEQAAARRSRPPESQGSEVRWRVAMCALSVSAGLMLMAVADQWARSGTAGAAPFFWISLVVVVLPAAFYAVRTDSTRKERILIVSIALCGLYAAKLFHSPFEYTFVDELQSLRSIDDVLRTQHLFVPNPLVSAYPQYPALSIVINGVSALTGLGTWASGVLIILAMRLLEVLSVFLILEHCTKKSSRAAALGTLVYATNPNFVFFSAQVAYESLALPLALATIALVAISWRSTKAREYWPMVLLLISTVAVAHHITSLWLVVVIVLWAAGAFAMRIEGFARLVDTAVVGLVIIGAWLVFVAGSAAWHELGPVLSGAVDSVRNLLDAGGTSSARRPFQSASGQDAGLVEQLVGFGSVFVLVIAIPIGYWRAMAWRPREPLRFVLVILTLLYPAMLLLRLTQAGSETSNRSSEFVFLGLAFIVPLVWLGLARRSSVRPLVASDAWVTRLSSVGVAVLLCGGITVGWAPYARQPGPYQVGAAAGSVEAQGILAARWAHEYLQPDSSFVADGTNRLLMASLGHLVPQTGQIYGVPVPNLFFSRTFGADEATIVTGDKIRYVVADLRITRLVSATGTYIERTEPDAYHHQGPLPAQSLAKFDEVPGFDRIFDSGDIRIYDTAGFLAEAGAASSVGP